MFSQHLTHPANGQDTLIWVTAHSEKCHLPSTVGPASIYSCWQPWPPCPWRSARSPLHSPQYRLRMRISRCCTCSTETISSGRALPRSHTAGLSWVICKDECWLASRLGLETWPLLSRGSAAHPHLQYRRRCRQELGGHDPAGHNCALKWLLKRKKPKE